MPPRKKKPPEAPVPAGQKDDRDRYETWTARIAAARKLREDWARLFRVEDGERYFLGQQGDTGLVFDLIEPTLKAKRPNLLFAHPKFYVRPRGGAGGTPRLQLHAAKAEGLLETVSSREGHLKGQGRFCVMDGFFRGWGVLKVCYEPTMVPNPQKGEPIWRTDETGEARLDEAGLPVPVTNPETGEPVREPEEILTDEVYRYQWVQAATLLLPDEGPDETRWTWIGEEVTRTLAEAKRDTRIPERVRARLTANVERMTGPDAKKPKLVTIPEAHAEPLFRHVEVYDVTERRFVMLADGQDRDLDFLVDTPTPDWIEDHPYALLGLGEPILGPQALPWRKPVVYSWLPIQDQQNILGTEIIEGGKRSARKGFYRENAFDDPEEAFKMLQSPKDMEFAKVTGEHGKDFGIFDVPDLNASIYKGQLILEQRWRVVTGQTGARLSDPDADTATEATFVERAASVRDSEDQATVEEWLAVAGRKMLQCVRATLTLNLWVKLKGASDAELKEYLARVYAIPPEILEATPLLKPLLRFQIGQERWTRLAREDLEFEAEVSVAPGSTRPKNLDAERNAFIKVLQVIAQAPQLALSRLLLERVAKYFEMDDPRLLDELQSLAQTMVGINANQAGRTQGAEGGSSQGAPGPAQNGAMGGTLGAVLSGATAGRPA